MPLRRPGRARARTAGIVAAVAGLALAAAALHASAGSAAATGTPVVYAAGDIACDPHSPSFNGGAGTASACRQRAVSDLIVGRGDAGAVLALGDNQYYCGSAAAYGQSFGRTDSWGRLKPLLLPAIGNHEYLTSGGGSGSTGCDASNRGAAGYFGYFGSASSPTDWQNCGTHSPPTCGGYYFTDLGAWRLIALNSNCGIVSCATGSAQETWLRTVALADAPGCILAFFHHPLYNSGSQGDTKAVQPLWADLYAAHASLVLNGHEHSYERFAPQDQNGRAVPDGIVEIIAGTGGSNHTKLVRAAPNSLVRDYTAFGALRLVLRPGAWESRFLPEPGGPQFSDQSAGTCARTSAATGGAKAVGLRRATLTARVSAPSGQATTYHFEFGRTPAYGTSTTPGPLPADGSPDVATTVHGLHPGLTYHFRVVLQTPAGTVVGTDATFRTRADPYPPVARVVPPPQPSAVGSWRVIRGRAADRSPSAGLSRVEANLVRVGPHGCAAYTGTRFASASCARAARVWARAGLHGGRWRLGVRGLAPGRYRLRVRAVDQAGNVQRRFVGGRSRFTLVLSTR